MPDWPPSNTNTTRTMRFGVIRMSPRSLGASPLSHSSLLLTRLESANRVFSHRFHDGVLVARVETRGGETGEFQEPWFTVVVVGDVDGEHGIGIIADGEYLLAKIDAVLRG